MDGPRSLGSENLAPYGGSNPRPSKHSESLHLLPHINAIALCWHAAVRNSLRSFRTNILKVFSPSHSSWEDFDAPYYIIPSLHTQTITLMVKRVSLLLNLWPYAIRSVALLLTVHQFKSHLSAGKFHCRENSLSAPCHVCRLNLHPSHITLNIAIKRTKSISNRQPTKSCSTVIWLG